MKAALPVGISFPFDKIFDFALRDPFVQDFFDRVLFLLFFAYTMKNEITSYQYDHNIFAAKRLTFRKVEE